MFGRIGYTWSLMRASWDVLKRDKQLVLFPLLSGICCLLVLASFAVPLAISGNWHPPGRHADQATKIIYYCMIFLYYFVNYFVITFFNVGIIACAIESLRGGQPTFGYGIREAMNRLPLIFGWALLSATVGLILRVIESRSEKVGQFVAGLLGLAWGVMSYLVVPVLVVEKLGPIAAIKESTRLLKSTWGEQVVGNFSFGGLFFLLMMLPVILLGALGVYAWGTLHSVPLALVCAALLVMLIITMGLVSSALQAIFQAAIYLHARGEETSVATHRGFPVSLLRDAMVAK